MLFSLKWLSLFLLTSCVFHAHVSSAQGDAVDGEDDEGKVEEESPDQDKAKAVVPPDNKDLDEEDEVAQIGPSPNAEAYMLFTQPTNAKELPAGGTVRMLLGLYNKGDEAFFVESVDAAFHYPMDHSFYIRNFTQSPVNRIVEPRVEATFAYAIMPSEDLAGRPFGLRVNLNYRALNGTKYASAVFNDTVQIVEDESGLSAETGFMYVLLACVLVLLLLLGQQLLQKMRKKAGMSGKKRDAPMEMGTSNNADIDWEWIPKEVLNHAKRSPHVPGSPKKSPRQRKGKKAGGRGDSGDSDGYDS